MQQKRHQPEQIAVALRQAHSGTAMAEISHKLGVLAPTLGLLRDVPMVDLLDIDIQGAEAEVCEAGARVIDEKVRRIYIGTHGVAIEHRLRALFRKLGWRNIFDYRMGRAQTTPFGRIMFGDGVQCWLNPRL